MNKCENNWVKVDGRECKHRHNETNERPDCVDVNHIENGIP